MDTARIVLCKALYGMPAWVSKTELDQRLDTLTKPPDRSLCLCWPSWRQLSGRSPMWRAFASREPGSPPPSEPPLFHSPKSQRHSLEPARTRRCHREPVAVPSVEKVHRMAGPAVKAVGMDEGFADRFVAVESDERSAEGWRRRVRVQVIRIGFDLGSECRQDLREAILSDA